MNNDTEMFQILTLLKKQPEALETQGLISAFLVRLQKEREVEKQSGEQRVVCFGSSP